MQKQLKTGPVRSKCCVNLAAFHGVSPIPTLWTNSYILSWTQQLTLQDLFLRLLERSMTGADDWQLDSVPV